MFHVKQINFPRIFLYIFLFTIPFQTRIIFISQDSYIGAVFSYTQNFMFYLTDGLFILTLASWLVSKKDYVAHETSRWLNAVLITFGVWIIIGSFQVEPIGLGLFHAVKWLELLIIIWLVPRVLRDYNYAFPVLFLGAILQALLGILQFHVQHSFGLSWLGEYVAPLGTSGLSTIEVMGSKVIRAYGTFSHPNVLAGFLVLGLGVGLHLVSCGTTVRNRILVSCGTIIVLIGLYVSFARTAWAIAALVIFIFLVRHIYTKEFLKLVPIVLMVLVSCGTIATWQPNMVKERVQELDSTSNSVVLRESFNKMGVEIFKTKPLTGVGAGNYISQMEKMFHLQDWEYQPVHNMFIFLAAETGTVGLVIFIVLLWKIASSTWNSRKQMEKFTLLVIFGGFIIISMFDHYFVTIQQGQLMFFTLLGLMLVREEGNINQNVSPD